VQKTGDPILTICTMFLDKELSLGVAMIARALTFLVALIFLIATNCLMR